jgi:hypothetical protein
METYRANIVEYTGDREYLNTFLIHAQDIDSATKMARKIAITWYDVPEDDIVVSEEGDRCEFFGGEITVAVDHISSCSRDQFIQSYMEEVEYFT